mgnify:FL=1
MIEENLGSSQFVGRDGFRWWIGQIAATDSQREQGVEGKEGWGFRYKVRIMGYHPFSEDVPTEDLPYAQVLLPVTAGSGAANYAQSPVLKQNDVVMGFFLDGDEAQVPMILGQFPRTRFTNAGNITGPFSGGTGYTDENPKNGKIARLESNEQHESSQVTNNNVGKPIDQSGSGKKVIVADTCTSNPISQIANVVENLAARVEEFALTGTNLANEVRAAADIIEVTANRFVGTMIEKLYDKLEGLGQKGLLKLYKTVFAKVLSATGSKIIAHAAGVAAQTAMLAPSSFLQEAIGCAANAAVEGLRGTIEDLLFDLLDSGRQYAGCMGAQFAGSFANAIIDKIADEMTKPLDAVAKIIAPGFKVVDFLLGASDVLNTISSFLDCSQSNKGKCPQDKEYIVGGSSLEKGDDPFAYVINAMQLSRGAASLANDFERQYGKWDIFGDGGLLSETESGIIPGGCYGGPPQNCTGPYVEIYGGGGSGAVAEVLMGYFIENATATIPGQSTGLKQVVGGVEKVGSIIGVQMKNFGSGYRYPPMVSFRDKCNNGYGGVGKAILGGPENDQVIAIVLDTTGENYPAIIPEDPGNIGVIDVIVVNPGTGYQPGDKVTIPGIAPGGETTIGVDTPEGVDIDFPDDFVPVAPIYDPVIDDEGRIVEVRVLNIIRYDEILPALIVQSETGVGARLAPIFGPIPEDRRDPVTGKQIGVITSTDCI